MRITLLVLVLIIALSGCSQADISTAFLMGTWKITDVKIIADEGKEDVYDEFIEEGIESEKAKTYTFYKNRTVEIEENENITKAKWKFKQNHVVIQLTKKEPKLFLKIEDFEEDTLTLDKRIGIGYARLTLTKEDE